MSISQSILDDPPPYVEEEIIKKPPVQVCGPPENPVFEPVEYQRLFGILTYTVNARIKKLMILLVILILLLAGITVTLLVVLLHHGSSEDTSRTPKIALNSIPTTKIAHNSIPTTGIPATTQTSNPNSKRTTANPEKTTVKTTPAVPDIPRCAPSPPFSPPYLFAYSNDLSKNVVELTAENFFGILDENSLSYATVRFDTQPLDLVYFAKDTSSALSLVQGRLPDRALSFKYSTIGSDIISTIQRYYTDAEQYNYSTCGAIIVILLKRLPTETDISEVVAKIRENSGMVFVITSTNPSGGDQSKTVYRIASKTNGMGIFVDDANFSPQIRQAPIFGVRPIYCANVQVSYLGFQPLPNFNIPSVSRQVSAEDNAPAVLERVSFTVQDHGPIDSFQRLQLKFLAATHVTIYVNATDVRNTGSTGYSTMLPFGKDVEYRTELDWDYSNRDVEELQIRIQSYEPYWIPYCD